MNGAVCGGYTNDGQGSSSTSTTQFNRDTNSFKDIWVSKLQNNVHIAKKALIDAISISTTSSIHDHGVVTPPASLTLSSSSVMDVTPLQTSGLTSFDSPHGWNMNVDEQDHLNITDDYHLCIDELAPVDQGSNYSTTLHPSSMENITQWLQRWTREYPNEESAMRNIIGSMEINPPIISDQGMMNGDGDNSMIPLLTSTENSMLHYEASFISSLDVVTDPSPPANILDRQHVENFQMLNMSTPYEQNVLWSFK